MTVREIVKKYLKENGFDGLWKGECGCEITDLWPCEDFMGNAPNNCSPGYKVPCVPEDCPNGGGCRWHISPEKPEGK